MSFIERKRKTAKRLAIVSGMAATAGYVAGILTAPKSGKQTRQSLKKAADRRYAEAEKNLKQLNDELGRVIKDAKDGGGKLSSRAQRELEDLVDRAKDTREKGSEMLSAVREGNAEDKDLKKAIKDADAALKHLRDYLKK